MQYLLITDVNMNIVSSGYADWYRIVLERMTLSAWNAKDAPYMLSHVCFFVVSCRSFLYLAI